MRRINQLDIAKRIYRWRENERDITWGEIADRLQCHPEKARSIFRRYESDITGKVDTMSLLDHEPTEELFTYNRINKCIKEFDEKERSDGYGLYAVFSDIHGEYCDRQALKAAIIKAKELGCDKAIILGDLFHLDSASSFPVSQDFLVEREVELVKDVMLVIATHFDRVYVVKGNHEERYERLLSKRIPNGLKYFTRWLSPIQTVIDDLKETECINNIYYTWGFELRLGNVCFLHPKHFSSVPGRTVLDMVDTYMMKNSGLSAVVIGHTHYDFKKCYKGVGAFETGCLCYNCDYNMEPRKRKDEWTTAFGVIKIHYNGDNDYNNSHVMLIGEEKRNG